MFKSEKGNYPERNSTKLCKYLKEFTYRYLKNLLCHISRPGRKKIISLLIFYICSQGFERLEWSFTWGGELGLSLYSWWGHKIFPCLARKLAPQPWVGKVMRQETWDWFSVFIMCISLANHFTSMQIESDQMSKTLATFSNSVIGKHCFCSTLLQVAWNYVKLIWLTGWRKLNSDRARHFPEQMDRRPNATYFRMFLSFLAFPVYWNMTVIEMLSIHWKLKCGWLWLRLCWFLFMLLRSQFLAIHEPVICIYNKW